MRLVNSFQPLTIFAKNSIVDFWLGSQSVSELHVEKQVILNEWVSKYNANV